MSSPFYLLEKLSFTHRIMEKEYAKRARQVVQRISPFLAKNEKIIDIGTGTSFVARGIIEKKVKT